MDELLPRLYVGGDDEYEAVKGKAGWSFVRCCKYGPGGHQDTLGYTSLAAPRGPEYLTARRGNKLALNFIDVMDPHFIPEAMVKHALQFSQERHTAGDKVLFACNKGQSRGPMTALLFLRATGELPGPFHGAENVFRTLHPKYSPGQGTRQFARSHWVEFENWIGKAKP